MKTTVFLLALLLAGACVSAQSLDSLDAALTKVDQQRSAVALDYDREKKQNEDRRRRIENGTASHADVQEAYASAARLDEMNSKLNELTSQKSSLCARWHALYGSTVDTLLASAEKEADKKKKAEAGRLLQRLQARNEQLCAENLSVDPLQWKSLSVEAYDGPQEIEQKVQLLKDIARENALRLARLEDLYRQSQKEHRTRERAQEFIQEGTLFDQTVTVRSTGGVIETGAAPGGSSLGTKANPPEASATGSTPGPEFGPEWRFSDNPKQAEEDYRKKREELALQQKDLQKKIAEFEEKAKTLLHP